MANTYASGSNKANGLIWRKIDTAFESRILTGAVINTDYIEPKRFLEDASNIVLDNVQKFVEKHGNIKINTVFNGEFVAGDKRVDKSISTENCKLFRPSVTRKYSVYHYLREWYARHVVEPTLAFLEEFQKDDSGWALSRIFDLTININKYNPMHARHHKLPQNFKNKIVVDVQSKDNAYFAWAVVAALYPAEKHVERQSSYPHYTEVLNLKGIEFPVTLKEIKKFEQLNSISINIYIIQENDKGGKLTIVPLSLADDKRDRHVNLLYMPDDPRNNNLKHFVWIKDLSQFIGQLSKKKVTKFICDR